MIANTWFDELSKKSYIILKFGGRDFISSLFLSR